jgi:hypothetical protein
MEKGRSMNTTAHLIVAVAAVIGIVTPGIAKADEVGFVRFVRPVQIRTIRTVIVPNSIGERVVYTNSSHRVILVRRVVYAGAATPAYRTHSTAAGSLNRATANETPHEGKIESGANAKSQDLQPDVLQQFADQAKRQEANPLPVVISN